MCFLFIAVDYSDMDCSDIRSYPSILLLMHRGRHIPAQLLTEGNGIFELGLKGNLNAGKGGVVFSGQMER